MCDRILKAVDDCGFTDRCVINTFSGRLHEYIRDVYGDHFRQHVYYPLNVLGGVTRDPYEYAYCCCMFRAFYSEIDLATKEECAIMQAKGVQTWAGASIRDSAGVDAVTERGCTLITCNNPDVILNELRKRGKHA